MASPQRRAELAGVTLTILLPLATAASAATVTAGSGTGSPNGFPFQIPEPAIGIAYVGEYQQIYSDADFTGPVSISGIAFSSGNNGLPSTQTYNFTIGLSTTSASLANPSTDYSINKGADFTTVYSGTLVANLTGTGTGTFDLQIPAATPFNYTPAQGNLLLDVVINSPTTGGIVGFLAGPSPDTSRVFNTNGNGVPTVSVGNGLLTRFTVGPQVPTVPEPSPLTLLALGLLPVGLLARRKRRA